ncbi:MAG: DUF3553 domain-containing protein [Pseudomonadota bacterium]
MTALFEPGCLVRSRENPDWGLGQVQSNANGRVTVNFEHAGKLVLADGAADLELVAPDWT